MDLEGAFLAHFGRPPQKGELQDPVLLTQLRRAYGQGLRLLPVQRQASNSMFYFPALYDRKTGETFFGGSQHWFARKTQQMGGCGPVAAANTLVCFARQNPAAQAAFGLRFLPDGRLDKQEFELFQQRVYRTIGTMEVPIWNKVVDAQNKQYPVPSTLGRDAAGFTAGALWFAAQNGVALKAHTMLPGFSKPPAGLAFIKKALACGSPVAMLTPRSPHPLYYYSPAGQPLRLAQQKMKSHFVTIAGVRPAEGGPQLLVSSWGRLFVVRYEELYQSWQKPLSIGAALVYFTPGQDIGRSKWQAAASLGMVPKTLLKTAAGTLLLPVKHLFGSHG